MVCLPAQRYKTRTLVSDSIINSLRIQGFRWQSIQRISRLHAHTRARFLLGLLLFLIATHFGQRLPRALDTFKELESWDCPAESCYCFSLGTSAAIFLASCWWVPTLCSSIGLQCSPAFWQEITCEAAAKCRPEATLCCRERQITGSEVTHSKGSVPRGQVRECCLWKEKEKLGESI